MRSIVIIVILLCGSTLLAEPAAFVVYRNEVGFEPPRIVIQHDPAAKTGFDWKAAAALYTYANGDAAKLRDAVTVFQEALRRMTGANLEVVSSNDLSKGIVLTTLAGASPEIKNDPTVQAALRNNGQDAYNHIEAFYIRSEPDRVLVVANTADGLAAAVPALLESTGYEVLALGPNWVHVPKGTKDRLAFQLELADRPSYYIRALTPTSGQSYGVGTIFGAPLSDPADEPVDVSYKRWAVGMRLAGQSMPGFPGHSLQAYHRAIVEHIRKTGRTDGFLCKTYLGVDADRPLAARENAGHLWINSDASGQGSSGKVYLSDGTKWNEASLGELGVNADLSEPFVRQLVFDEMKKNAAESFRNEPDRVFVFGAEPEDGGGYATLSALLHHRNWYPDYLASRGVPFRQPYVLHGYKGIDQPRETWDPDAPADTVFGFGNWLLREFDAWVDTLPAAEQVTVTGRPKKELARVSFYSYNYHDVPPNFNLDPRIRVMIASYPKHRGRDKWKMLVSQRDMARAFQVMLPREPSGDYRIISLSYYSDFGVDGLPAHWSAAPASIARDLSETWQAGIKALNYETDFNFGKYGLAYYLMGKMLWNTRMSATDLDALRDRWLQRAYGDVWKEMKAYYDFMLSDRYPVNAPQAWAQAIRLLDAADRKLDASREPDAKRRLDDLKQYWYCHYLFDSDKMKSTDPDARAFVWKGQMSYANAMHVITRRVFNVQNGPAEAVGPELAKGPAHYTAAETAAWWAKILERWQITSVSQFTDATLANGKKGQDVDVNDLVLVEEFQEPAIAAPFIYNSGYQKPMTFLAVASAAGESIGCKLWWPKGKDPSDGYYIAKDLAYGVEGWEPERQQWELLVDKTMVTQRSREIEVPQPTKDDPAAKQIFHLAEVRYPAPRPGTYRISIGYGGNLSRLASLAYDIPSGMFTSRQAMTYFATAEGLTQSAVYFYIPKGTKSVDLEVWDAYKAKTLTLHTGSLHHPVKKRKVDISERGTHRVPLEAAEDGTIAMIESNGFAFPFLYSVPSRWAKSPSELAIPRAIAEADGWTIIQQPRSSR